MLMDKSKPAADRVRPILQAMERSIDAARQRRTRETRPGQPQDTPNPVTPDPTAPDGEQPRLRARPKRSTPMTGMDDRTPLRPRDP